MIVTKKQHYYYHGLGHYDDQDNLETSYYLDIVDSANQNRANERDSYFRRELVVNPGLKTDYDIVSLTRLKEICKQKAILPRSISGYQLAGLRGSFCGNPSDTVCLTKHSLVNITFMPKGVKFISRSLSILIDSKIKTDLKKDIKDYKEIRKSNVMDTSLSYGEYRVLGPIPSTYFIAVVVPFTHIKNQRFVRLKDYYQERIKEIRIIRNILDEYGISIPIIDTRTCINLEDTDKVKKLIK